MMNIVNKKYKKDLNSLKKIMNKMKILVIIFMNIEFEDGDHC